MISANDYDQAATELRRPAALKTGGELDARELVRFATLAASSHNTQPWKFRLRPDSITILPDYLRRCPAVDPDNSHLFKSLGCATENLVQAAAAQGFVADARFDSEEDGVVIRLKRAATAEATDLFRAITKRQCTRNEYDGQPLSPAELEKLETAGKTENVRLIFLLSEAQKETIIGYVTQGNLAQLTDRAFRKELVSWIRFNPGAALQTGDGLSGRASGQPPLPTWLAKGITSLVLTPKTQAETDARNIRSSAGIVVFVSSRNDKAAWVEAGRAYERFALQATVLGIRNAFINQPIEVPALRPHFESWLKLDGEHAMLIARFGHGPAAPFSLRRPLDDVIIQDRCESRAAAARAS
jgi:Nitroreductase family